MSRTRAVRVALPVVDAPAKRIRRSRMGRLRAVSLIAVHVLILGHLVHWRLTGRTLSPVEPSEAMFTLNQGWVNAGFIFFAAALLSTLIFGRFVCGWGCHLLAYQDLCGWLLRKAGIKPKPFRSRLLVFGPLALALYMFVWPSAYRWAMGVPRPAMQSHLMTTTFWQTFPGPIVAVITFAVCGFAIIYFFGSKGFCTYACPYGGFFKLLDRASPARIRVTEDCTHCGHCTASCTSNVRVHEEVALYGGVVDSGCMKCMDCVSVCPEHALYFGYGKPALGAKPSSPRRARVYDFALWEEGLMVVVGAGALLGFRGLYGQIPLLLAMAMAAMTAFVTMRFVHLVWSANVRWQNLQLKRGGRVTATGWGLAATAIALLAFTSHSAAVQFHAWRGASIVQALRIGDEVWTPGHRWWSDAPPDRRARAEAALSHLEWVDRWGFLATPEALSNAVWLYLAQDRDAEAETTVRRLIELRPADAGVHRGLANVLRKRGRFDEAESQFRSALRLDPALETARRELVGLLTSRGKWDDVIVALREAVEGDPEQSDGHYNLGMALVETRRIEDAVAELTTAVRLRPASALAQYNLGVALFMSGRPGEALPHVEEAVRLEPDDTDARGFLDVVRREAGEP